MSIADGRSARKKASSNTLCNSETTRQRPRRADLLDPPVPYHQHRALAGLKPAAPSKPGSKATQQRQLLAPNGDESASLEGQAGHGDHAAVLDLVRGNRRAGQLNEHAL